MQTASLGLKNKNGKEISNPLKIKYGEGIVGYVAKSGIGEIVNDTSKDSRYIIDDDCRFSEITIPIIYEGKVIGIIDSSTLKKIFSLRSILNYFKPFLPLLQLK